MINKIHLVIIGFVAIMNALEYKYNDNHRIIIPDQKEIDLLPSDGGPMWNRLIFEKSPYLLQHAANPVDWYPWSKEAFEIANNENKPIFLSIGYTTCHWCHVMEHESFEDSDVAKLMNETFINIKVDREERPDIDNIYMEVTQMINGRGGWPMTVIMTPAKKPFFAGTYFPKESRYNRIGMKELVPQINDLWRTKNDSIMNSANKITNTLINRNINRNKKTSIDNDKLLLSAFNTFNKNFDVEYGGFKGSRNKFPKPHDYSFLIRYYNRTDNKKALDIVNKSLYSMKLGGLYDQIGFGFHRYSTDPKWLVPHFEKMLYDQAMLIHAYLDAYLITEDSFYKETVEEIIKYVFRDMTSDKGGFYSAEDADSEGEEGLFYIWDYDQVSIALVKDNNIDNLKFISDVLNINKDGNCKVEGHKTNIPYFKNTWEEISKNYNSDISSLKIKFHKLRNEIFEYRKKRVHPQKDDKILTDWNGLMISAVSRAGAIFDNEDYLKAAEKAADFIIDNLQAADGSLLKRYREGVSGIDGMIEDYSFLVWGLIELYQSTLKEKYILEAVRLADYQLKHFWDYDNGGFFFTSNKSEKLLIRNKEIYDGAIPSGNSVSAYNYIRLGRIMSRPDFEKVSFDLIESFSNNINRYSSGYTMLLHAIDFIEGPSYEVIISGKKNKSKDILNYLYNNKQLHKVIIFNRPSNKRLDNQFEFLDNYKSGKNNSPLVYVCKNYACNLPTDDLELIEKQLNNK